MIVGVTLPSHCFQPCRMCLVPLTEVQLLFVLLVYSASSKQASNLLCWGGLLELLCTLSTAPVLTFCTE